MNAGIIAGQMLVLFFMMLAGFIAFKAHIVSQEGSRSLSSVIINIFNPCLIISGVLNKKITYSPHMVAENLVLVAVFFLVLILLSRLFTKLMGTRGGKQLPPYDDIPQPGIYGNPAGAQPVWGRGCDIRGLLYCWL